MVTVEALGYLGETVNASGAGSKNFCPKPEPAC
jgi:hypothetical protein